MVKKNWKSKMFISVLSEDGTQLLSPILEINPTFNTPHNRVHSLEADNVGIVKTNDEFGLSLTVNALRDETAGTNPSKLLTLLQLNHTKFQIVMIERQTVASEGSEWAFDDILFEDVYVNNSTPTRGTINGAPVAVFNCVALGVNIDGAYFNGTIPVPPPTTP